MFCMKCGKELSDNARFCRYCGTSVVPENRADVPVEEPPVEDDIIQGKGKRKKSSTAVKVLLIIIAVVIVLAAGTLVTLRYFHIDLIQNITDLINGGTEAAAVGQEAYQTDESAIPEVEQEAYQTDPAGSAVEETKKEDPEILSGQIYVSVFKYVRVDDPDYNTQVKYYPSRGDYLNETNSSYAYMKSPATGYVGDNYMLEGASLEYRSDLEYPVLKYDWITVLE
ncbi:MAG: zinc-ribbon domain-containing protein [Lachnospiraceae bacterium]|nr:zinc-ribbon domain-containing protein [Lachnospiraceae bacterium]